MIVPKTKDGRVVFMLPWLDQTIAGTTDSSTEITMQPQVGRAQFRRVYLLCNLSALDHGQAPTPRSGRR